MFASCGWLFEVRRKPLQLLLADQRARIRYIVQRDEMHALVVERVMRLTEELLVRFTVIEGSVVLARHEADVLYLEFADDILELGKALPAHLRVVGGMSQVAGEHDKVGLLGQAVYGSNGLLQRPLGVGVGRAFEAPVCIRQLNEIEVIVSRALAAAIVPAARAAPRLEANTTPPKPANFRNSRRSIGCFMGNS